MQKNQESKSGKKTGFLKALKGIVTGAAVMGAVKFAARSATALSGLTGPLGAVAAGVASATALTGIEMAKDYRSARKELEQKEALKKVFNKEASKKYALKFAFNTASSTVGALGVVGVDWALENTAAGEWVKDKVMDMLSGDHVTGKPEDVTAAAPQTTDNITEELALGIAESIIGEDEISVSVEQADITIEAEPIDPIDKPEAEIEAEPVEAEPLTTQEKLEHLDISDMSERMQYVHQFAVHGDAWAVKELASNLVYSEDHRALAMELYQQAAQSGIDEVAQQAIRDMEIVTNWWPELDTDGSLREQFSGTSFIEPDLDSSPDQENVKYALLDTGDNKIFVPESAPETLEEAQIKAHKLQAVTNELTMQGYNSDDCEIIIHDNEKQAFVHCLENK
jgi:hypothetical protein